MARGTEATSCATCFKKTAGKDRLITKSCDRYTPIEKLVESPHAAPYTDSRFRVGYRVGLHPCKCPWMRESTRRSLGSGPLIVVGSYLSQRSKSTLPMKDGHIILEVCHDPARSSASWPLSLPANCGGCAHDLRGNERSE